MIAAILRRYSSDVSISIATAREPHRASLVQRIDSQMGRRLAGYGALPRMSVQDARTPSLVLWLGDGDPGRDGVPTLELWWRDAHGDVVSLGAPDDVPVGVGAIEVGWRWVGAREHAPLAQSAVVGLHAWSPAVTRARLVRGATLALAAWLARADGLLAPPTRDLPLEAAQSSSGRLGVRWAAALLATLADQLLRRSVWQLCHTPDPRGEAPPSGVASWPRARFDQVAADPMPAVGPDGSDVVFFEILQGTGAARRGVIAVAAIEQGSVRLGAPRTVLQAPFHLSFPGIVRDGPFTAMLPETRGARAILLFPCLQWPDRWGAARTLVADVDAVDPCLVEHGGRWWLLAAMGDPAGPEAMGLYGWVADTLDGPFEPVSNGPLLLDTRRSRAGGPITSHDGRLLRPAQDGSANYGSRVHIMQVLALDLWGLREVRVRVHENEGRGAVATHHLAAESGRWFSDIGTRESRLRAWFDGTLFNRGGFTR
jgi:hypothetical protein